MGDEIEWSGAADNPGSQRLIVAGKALIELANGRRAAI